MKSPTALHWFTSDLRLRDNPALAAAAGRGAVAGVFVLDPSILRRHAAAPRRVAFLRACVAALDGDLRARGSRLVVLTGDVAEEVPWLACRLGARVVTHATNLEPAARAREARVAGRCAAAGLACEATDVAHVQPPGTIRTGDGRAYVVYGAYARAWEAAAVRPAVATPRLWVPAPALRGVGAPDTLRDAAAAGLPPAGETAARARLARFLRTRLRDYRSRRDLPAADATSRLSYHLRFGTLSAAEAGRRARAAAARDPRLRDGARAWLRELAWRDFFAQLLAAFPRVAREPMRPLPVHWRIADADLCRWQEGRTGVPFVDAGMRELAATGWMHNRARMVTASFLARHLLVDWRAGERHFMATLLDAELAQNDGNWQWVAGTGADAQPWFRILSPVRQGERFDPGGDYVRRWVPELRRVPARRLHAPWTLTRGERRALCPDYPPPVVDPDVGRARAAAALAAAARRRV